MKKTASNAKGKPQRPPLKTTQAIVAPKRSVLGRGLSVLMRSTLRDEAPLASSPTPASNSEAVTSPLGNSHPSEQHAVANVSSPSTFYHIEPHPLAITEQALIASQEKEEMAHDAIKQIALERITASSLQPRKRFSEDELRSLAQSIKESGLLQPILLRRKSHSEDGADLEIVAGERRFRAAKLAGLSYLPALIRELSDKEALALGIIENIQRADLNPIEEAQAYKRLMTDFNESAADIAKTVGKDRSSVVNSIRLLKLPDEVQELMTTGKLSAGHGRAILMCEELEGQRVLAQRILAEGFSVRQAEELARSGTASEAEGRLQRHRQRREKTPAIHELEERLRRILGTKVSLQLNAQGRGELRISLFSRGELDVLLEKLGA